MAHPDQIASRLHRLSDLPGDQPLMASWWTRIVLNAADYPPLCARTGWTEDQIDQIHKALSDAADDRSTRPADPDLKADLFRLSHTGLDAQTVLHAVRAGLTVAEIVSRAAAGDLDQDLVAVMAALRPPVDPPARPVVDYLSLLGHKSGAGKTWLTLADTVAPATPTPTAFHRAAPA